MITFNSKQLRNPISGSFQGDFTGNLTGTASFVVSSSMSISSSFANQALSSSYAINSNTASYSLFAVTASNAPNYLPLTGGTINGNVIINGTASISVLNVSYESASVIYSSGSNQFGDASNDVQTFWGTVDVKTGPVLVTGSLNVSGGITGSLFGTASYSTQALTSSYATTASNILGGKATHVPFFITDTTLATSSIYQSGSSTVIINQDNATTANPEALYVWQPSATSFNVISGKGDIDNYLQLNIQNTNQGINASSDVVATANNGNESINYIDMGINSQNYNAGFIGGVNDAYLYSTGRHLHIGNAANFPLQLFAGGSDVDVYNKLELSPNNQHSMSGSLDVSGSIKAFSFTGSLLGNASTATTSTSASHALIADNAANATYAATAGNGGVTSIIAGSGITLPFGGAGNVTIVASGGGGVTIISGSLVTGSFNNTNSYTFNHNLNTRTPIITVFDSNYNQIIPENISLDTTSSATITFPTLESGFAIGSTGGTTGTALSSSYSLFATYADSASYFPETDPIFVAKSASLATTGSNTFRGSQTITGSGGRLTYTGAPTGIYPTLAEIHANNDDFWLERFYNDTFSTSSAIMAYFGWSDGRFVFHNESTQSIGLQVNGFNAENGLLVYSDKVAFVNNVEVTGSLSQASGIASGSYSHAEGRNTQAIGNYSHAEGDTTIAQGGASHAEGLLTLALGLNSHAEGLLTTASANYSHAEGQQTQARGEASHAEGLGTVASGLYQHVQGQYNISSSVQSAFIIGNGANGNNRSNLVFAAGNTFQITGSLNVSGSTIQTGNNTLIGNTILSGSIGISGSSTIQGATIMSGSLSISGSTTQTGNNTLIGTTTLTGSIFINGDIIPQVSSSYDLGSLTNPWRSIYVQSGSISIQSDIPGGIPATISNANGNVTFAGAGFQLKSGSFVPFEVSSTARTVIRIPNIPANDIGGLSVIGSSDGTYQPVINPSGMIHVTSNDNQAARITVDGFGSNIGTIFVGRHARGTSSTPTPTLLGDVLVRFAGLGYATSSYFPVVGAVPTSLEFQATENYSTSSYGSKAVFYTYANGAVSRSLVATIDTTGITIPSSSRFFGTSSWAENALTASYVRPLIQNVIITGSLKVSGSLTEIGDTVLSGSLTLSSGSRLNLNNGFYVNGNLQYNYGQFSSTQTQSGSADTAYSMTFDTTDFSNGVSLVSGSRITISNTGIYNIQFSSQLHTTANQAVDFSIWFAMTGSNIANSNTDYTVEKISGGGFAVAALNFLTQITSGSYVELKYSKTTLQGQLQAKTTQASPSRPATPSAIVTVTQIA